MCAAWQEVLDLALFGWRVFEARNLPEIPRQSSIIASPHLFLAITTSLIIVEHMFPIVQSRHARISYLIQPVVSMVYMHLRLFRSPWNCRTTFTNGRERQLSIDLCAHNFEAMDVFPQESGISTLRQREDHMYR